MKHGAVIVCVLSMGCAELTAAGDEPAEAAEQELARPPARKMDILWRCLPVAPATSCGAVATGATMIWRGADPYRAVYPGVVGLEWELVGSGQFTSTPGKDMVWRSINGDTAIWPDGESPGYWLEHLEPAWTLAGIGDFDGNGRSDLLFRNVDGSNVVWPGGAKSAAITIPSKDPSYRVEAVADFDGDAASDVLWRNAAGTAVLWPRALLDELLEEPAGTTTLPVAAAGYFNHVPTPLATADVLRNAGGGSYELWIRGREAGKKPNYLSRDPSWRLVAIDDFDESGPHDLLWRHVSGANELWLDQEPVFVLPLAPLSPSWQVAAIGDFVP